MKLSLSIIIITVISFTLGFGRDLLIARTFGATWYADAIFVALIIPVFFENIFGLSFRDALIPHLLQKKTKNEFNVFLAEVKNLYFSAAIIGLLFFVLFAVGPKFWLHLVAPGWTEVQVNDGVPIFILGTSLIFIQTVLYFQSALLNIEMRFVLPLWRTVLFNLGSILALLLMPGNLIAVFCGMILGQLVLLVIMHRQTQHLHSVSVESKIKPSFHFIAGFMPILIATIALQGCIIAERLFASTLNTGSITLLSYAYRIVTIPLTLFTLSVLAVLYSAISKNLAESDHCAGSSLVRKGGEIALAFLVPPAVLFTCMPNPTIAMILERGAFGPAETSATAALMTGYAIGLPGMGLALLWGRILLAQKREKEFLHATVLTFIITVIVDMILLKPFGAMGLAIAFTAGSWVQAIVTGGMIRRELPDAIPALCLLRWLISALLVGTLLAYCPEPKNMVNLALVALFVFVAHAVFIAILGERVIFTKIYWKLRPS